MGWIVFMVLFSVLLADVIYQHLLQEEKRKTKEYLSELLGDQFQYDTVATTVIKNAQAGVIARTKALWGIELQDLEERLREATRDTLPGLIRDHRRVVQRLSKIDFLEGVYFQRSL